ncbi:EpsG family protein [Ancylomarina salipaludis]|uniref:EpsG family protein n=1 Tax=Ancylomarina salipaludis TaxID=2501299 RepID=A0A4Q1JKH9_9BACT|nr:EpsG family protein [Ancylomarina salipaludis]RXQ93858.1 EpsG family protein [Ancylomarina salipaludis]
MNDTQLYTQGFYYILLILAVVYYFIVNHGVVYKSNVYKFISFVLVTFFIVYWGSRDIDLGTDSANYISYFNMYKISPSFFSAREMVNLDLIFAGLLYVTSNLASLEVFNLILSCITISCFLFFSIHFSKYLNSKTGVFLLLMFASLQGFSNIQCNIIRNGLALSFFLVFQFFYVTERYKKSLIFALLAIFSHYSVLIFIAISIVAKNIKLKDIHIYIIVGLSSFLSFMGMGLHSITFISRINNVKIDRYFNNITSLYKVGFRLDFLVYNLFFLMLFMYFKKKNSQYEFFLNYYVITTVLFILWFNIPYSDRIGLYCWFTIPILLFVTLSERKNSTSYLFLATIFLLVVNYFII